MKTLDINIESMMLDVKDRLDRIDGMVGTFGITNSHLYTHVVRPALPAVLFWAATMRVSNVRTMIEFYAAYETMLATCIPETTRWMWSIVENGEYYDLRVSFLYESVMIYSICLTIAQFVVERDGTYSYAKETMHIL